MKVEVTETDTGVIVDLSGKSPKGKSDIEKIIRSIGGKAGLRTVMVAFGIGYLTIKIRPD